MEWTNSRVRPSLLKSMVAYLLSHPNVRRDKLALDFWPEDEKARRRLSLLLTLIVQCLQGEYLVRAPETIGWVEPFPWHDLGELIKACREAERLESAGHLEEAASWRQKAARLYRGPFLEDCAFDWALPIRAGAERLALDALQRLSSYLLDTGRADQSLEWAQRVLELDDCHQEAYLLSMRAFLALQRFEEAVRTYERCQRVLKRELDMEPSIKIFELYQRARLSL